jgi:hypothetical protein
MIQYICNYKILTYIDAPKGAQAQLIDPSF